MGGFVFLKGVAISLVSSEKIAHWIPEYLEAKVEEETKPKPSVRKRADEIRDFRCKNLIAVIENPTDIKNIGTVIRNVNALGVEKVYVVDPRKSLPDDWQDLRERKSISKTSVSAVKWTFVKRFDSTDECFDHLEKSNFKSIVTSPHVKGKTNIMLHEGDFTEHTKLAVWFGSETRGISDLAVARSEACLSIPMRAARSRTVIRSSARPGEA